jgi:hypothetical protein
MSGAMVGIVVDHIRTAVTEKVNIGSFRTCPTRKLDG